MFKNFDYFFIAKPANLQKEFLYFYHHRKKMKGNFAFCCHALEPVCAMLQHPIKFKLKKCETRYTPGGNPIKGF